MRNTRNWKHTTKHRKQYGNRSTVVEYAESEFVIPHTTVRITNKHLTPFMVETFEN